MSAALAPCVVHAVDGLSTVSIVDEFGTSSTLIHADAAAVADASHAASFDALAFTTSWPMPVKFLSRSTSNTTSTVLKGATAATRCDPFLIDSAPVGDEIETVVSTRSI